MHFSELVSGSFRSSLTGTKLMTSLFTFFSLRRSQQLFTQHLQFSSLFSMGRPKHVRIMAGALEGDLFVGPKAEDHRGLLSIRYPMEHGIVTDWNDMERIWTHVYSKVRCTSLFEEHSLMGLNFRTSCRHFPKNIQSFSQKLHSTLERIARKPPRSSSKLSTFPHSLSRCRLCLVCTQQVV